MRRLLALLLLVATPVAALAQDFSVAAQPEPSQALEAPQVWLSTVVAPEMISPLTLQARSLSGTPRVEKPKKGKKAKPAKPAKPAAEPGMALGAERARILLRSLVMPGWGQATMGHRKSGAWFATAEVGIWTAFASFRVQETMRRQTAQRTARLEAGIDLRGRDEEFQRIVGSFVSSDEYNLLVVARDAANIYMVDPYAPDMDGFRAYIAAHSLGGSDAWNWSSVESFRRYTSQRKDAQRAGLRSNTVLAVGIANRIASAVHAARVAGRPRPVEPRSWNLELVPDPRDPTALRGGVHVTF